MVIGVAVPGFIGVQIGHRFDVAVPICADPMFWEAGKGRIPTPTGWLRRVLLHLVPKGFVRIRHFGFLATRRRTALVPISPLGCRDSIE